MHAGRALQGGGSRDFTLAPTAGKSSSSAVPPSTTDIPATEPPFVNVVNPGSIAPVPEGAGMTQAPTSSQTPGATEAPSGGDLGLLICQPLNATARHAGPCMHFYRLHQTTSRWLTLVAPAHPPVRSIKFVSPHSLLFLHLNLDSGVCRSRRRSRRAPNCWSKRRQNCASNILNTGRQHQRTGDTVTVAHERISINN